MFLQAGGVGVGVGGALWRAAPCTASVRTGLWFRESGRRRRSREEEEEEEEQREEGGGGAAAAGSGACLGLHPPGLFHAAVTLTAGEARDCFHLPLYIT